MQKLEWIFKSRVSICFIFILGIFLRIYGLDQWSLCEDEEAALCYSSNLDRPFPQFFPLFFRLLSWIFSITGDSTAWGRFPAAVFGILSIWITYVCVRKFFSQEAAVLASFILTINLGHMFWSQSIRYYSAVYLLLQISIYFFLDGFENDRSKSIIWSNIFLFLATMTHSSAILIVPVYVVYLFYMKLIKTTAKGYSLKNYMIYAVLLIFGLSFFIYNSFIIHHTMSAIIIPSAMDPKHIMITFFAYFGFPVIVLGLISIFTLVKQCSRSFIFFLILSILPILEILVISMDTSVTWYHGLIALNGFIILSSVGIIQWLQNGFGKTVVGVLILTIGYYVCFLGFYYTSSFGARPRWKEAAQFVMKRAEISVAATDNPDIFATAPGVVAYYMGVPSGKTMGHPLVQRLEFKPPERSIPKNTWLLIKSNYISPEYETWLKQNCLLEQKFISKIGPFDRWSIFVYRALDN